MSFFLVHNCIKLAQTNQTRIRWIGRSRDTALLLRTSSIGQCSGDGCVTIAAIVGPSGTAVTAAVSGGPGTAAIFAVAGPQRSRTMAVILLANYVGKMRITSAWMAAFYQPLGPQIRMCTLYSCPLSAIGRFRRLAFHTTCQWDT